MPRQCGNTRLLATFCRFLSISLVAVAACTPDYEISQQSYVFGTLVTVQISAAKRDQGAAALAALDRRFATLDVDWYAWPKTPGGKAGELARINQAIAAGQSIRVQPILAKLIRQAIALETKTERRFAVATGKLSELWGLTDATNRPLIQPSRPSIDAVLSALRTQPLLAWDGDILRSNHSGVTLDLGGIAKGAILEDSARILALYGVDNAIINLGGDIRVVGDVGGQPARIGIRSPTGSTVLGWLEVHDGETVVTSGDYERFVRIDGQRFSHIIDPRTGYPVGHTSAVTVVNNDAILADAAATALVVGGIAEFDELCNQLGITEALLVDAAGDMRLTSAMRERVNWQQEPPSY